MNKNVVIIIGHGGSDPGAVDPKNPKEGDTLYTEEADINLIIGKKLSEKLKGYGWGAKLSRVNDAYLSPNEQVTFINNSGAGLAVSIHCNSASPQAEGVECWVKTTQEKIYKVADATCKNLAKITGFKNRGVHSLNERPKSIAVIRAAKIPSYLIELGFISNTKEEIILNNPIMQDKIAEAIAWSITSNPI